MRLLAPEGAEFTELHAVLLPLLQFFFQLSAGRGTLGRRYYVERPQKREQKRYVRQGSRDSFSEFSRTLPLSYTLNGSLGPSPCRALLEVPMRRRRI